MKASGPKLETGTQNTVSKGVQAPSEMTLSQAREKYTRHLERREFSPRTRIKQIGHLRLFEKFMESQEVSTISAIQRHHIGKWREYLSAITVRNTGVQYNLNSQGYFIITTICFFRFLVREGVIKDNPALRLRVPGVIRVPDRNSITHQDITALLNTFDTNTYHGFYDRAWAELATGSALRIGELIHLELRDIHHEERLLHLRNTKNRRDRMAPITKYSLSFLDFYIQNIRKVYLRVPGSPFLFPSVSGRPQLVAYFEKRITEAATLSGLKKKVTFHVLRKGAATALLDAGSDVRLISSFLGHRSLVSTQTYLATRTEDLREILIRHHPLERKPSP